MTLRSRPVADAWRIIWLLMVAWLAMAAPALAETFQGKVVRVLDGDTIEVLHERTPVRIRLSGIDAPESGQPFGAKATRFVREHAAQQHVTVKIVDTDRYGRSIGEIFLPDGSSLNREIIKAGYAWWYRQYSRDASLGALEAQARAESRGLWADPNSIAPWEWRAASRRQSTLPATTELSALSDEPFRGNVRSQVFHQVGCKDYECKNCTKLLASREEALRKGFRPCGSCRP